MRSPGGEPGLSTGARPGSSVPANPRLGYQDGWWEEGARWRRPSPLLGWEWGRGRARHVTALASRALPIAPGTRQESGSFANGGFALLGVSSRVPAKSGGSLAAAESRSGSRKRGTGPCRSKGAAEQDSCSSLWGRRSEHSARGWAGDLAGILRDSWAGRWGRGYWRGSELFTLTMSAVRGSRVPSGLQAFDLAIFRVSHGHLASKPAELKKGFSQMFSSLWGEGLSMSVWGDSRGPSVVGAEVEEGGGSKERPPWLSETCFPLC